MDRYGCKGRIWSGVCSASAARGMVGNLRFLRGPGRRSVPPDCLTWAKPARAVVVGAGQQDRQPALGRRHRRPSRTGSRWPGASSAPGLPGSATSCGRARPTGDNQAWRNTGCPASIVSLSHASCTGMRRRRANTSASRLRRSSGRCSTTMIGTPKPAGKPLKIVSNASTPPAEAPTTTASIPRIGLVCDTAHDFR